MSSVEFIQGLEIAHDDRLRRLGTAEAWANVSLRRDGTGTGQRTTAFKAAIDPGLRATVNGGSVVSFVAGLSETEKSDVLFSTQLAQRAASARHDRHAATSDWYRAYTEVLEQLGWTGEGLAFTRPSASAGTVRMDKSALDVIATIATGNQLAILVKALDVLKGMAEDDGGIRVFELQAVAALSGSFQLGAVQRAENGALSMALGAFHFRSTEARRRVLFWSWGADDIEFWTAAGKMTLNTAHYDRVRQAVIDKLADDAADYIVRLDRPDASRFGSNNGI